MSGLVRSSVLLLLQKLFSAVLSFILPIYLTNTVSSAILGSYFLFVSLQSVLSLFAMFGVGSALIKFVSSKNNPGQYVGGGFIIVSVMTVILVTASFFFRTWINEYVGADIWILLAIGLAATAFANCYSTVLIGEDRIPTNAMTSLVGQAVSVPAQMAVAAFGLFPLIGAYNLRFLIILGLAIILVRTPLRMPNRGAIRAVSQYGARAVVSSVEKHTLQWADLFVIGIFLQNSAAGIYGAIWVISSAAFLPAQAIGTTIFPEVSSLESEEEQAQLTNIISLALFASVAIVLPILGGSLLVGEQLLRAFYTPEYATAWGVLVIMLIGRLFHAIHRIGRNGLLALNRPDKTFRVGILAIVTNIGFNFILVPRYELVGAAMATTFSIALATGPFLYYISILTTGSIFPVRDISESAISTLLMMGYIYIVISAGIGDRVGILFGVLPDIIAVLFVVLTGGLIYWLTLVAINEQASNGTRKALVYARKYV